MRLRFPAARELFIALGLLFFAGGVQASDVYPDAASTRALEQGSTVPAAEVTAIDGTTVDVSEFTRESGALLVFYRGGW